MALHVAEPSAWEVGRPRRPAARVCCVVAVADLTGALNGGADRRPTGMTGMACAPCAEESSLPQHAAFCAASIRGMPTALAGHADTPTGQTDLRQKMAAVLPWRQSAPPTARPIRVAPKYTTRVHATGSRVGVGPPLLGVGTATLSAGQPRQFFDAAQRHIKARGLGAAACRGLVRFRRAASPGRQRAPLFSPSCFTTFTVSVRRLFYSRCPANPGALACGAAVVCARRYVGRGPWRGMAGCGACSGCSCLAAGAATRADDTCASRPPRTPHSHQATRTPPAAPPSGTLSRRGWRPGRRPQARRPAGPRVHHWRRGRGPK